MACHLRVVAKVINIVPVIVPVFHWNETLDLYINVPDLYRFEFQKILKIKV